MPRYFFHVEDHDNLHKDDQGEVLCDVADARREAIARAEVLVADRSVEAWYSYRWALSVVDETGHELLRLTIERQQKPH